MSFPTVILANQFVKLNATVSSPLQVQLEDDMIVAKHLTTLYSNMLEHNLCRYFDFLGVIILIY